MLARSVKHCNFFRSARAGRFTRLNHSLVSPIFKSMSRIGVIVGCMQDEEVSG